MKTATLPLALLLLATTSVVHAKPPPSKSAAEATPARPAAAEPTAAPTGAPIGAPIGADDCAGAGPLPGTWSGVAYAIDGGTLAAVGLKPHIRLWGIQAPELRDGAKAETVPGMRARAELEDILSKSDHKLRCRPLRHDRQCRVVAHCTLDAGADSIDVGGAMIASGMAYGFSLDEVPSWEPKASQRYADAEFEARKQRRGLWPVWLGEK
jgi:endonuclease YncB( thermonuclease family)